MQLTGVTNAMYYKHEFCTYEFDATSRADELAQVRDICKERGWTFSDLVKEE